MNLIEKCVKVVNSYINEFTWIRIGTCVTDSYIDTDVFVGFNCLISNTEIMSNVQIASKTSIGSVNGKKTIICKNVWIGVGVTIEAGVTIGEGAVIGAGTIVTCNVQPYSIVVGRPEKVIKKRLFDNDYEPEFRNMLLIKIKEKSNGIQLKKGRDGNFVSADILENTPLKLGINNIFIGKKVLNGGIYCGANVVIGDNNIFEGAGKISIGDYTVIGNNVHMISNAHDYSKLSLPMKFQPVKIGNGVIIENNVTILGNVSIGDNAKILENSLIVKDVLDNTLSSGIFYRGV